MFRSRSHPAFISAPSIARVLGNFLVPDLSIRFWACGEIRRKTADIVSTLQPDVLLTTGPPHSIHELGFWCHQRSRIPWIADFRDPYLIDPYNGPR
jgi:hypothetical protein